MLGTDGFTVHTLTARRGRVHNDQIPFPCKSFLERAGHWTFLHDKSVTYLIYQL